MNDEFLTEEQEAEKARQWVRENGLYIVAGVVLGLGGLFGWQAWEDDRLQTAGDASIVWEQLRAAADGQRYNEVDETLDILETEFAATPYVDQARLLGHLLAAHLGEGGPGREHVVELLHLALCVR